jgi:hypothetical protein
LEVQRHDATRAQAAGSAFLQGSATLRAIFRGVYAHARYLPLRDGLLQGRLIYFAKPGRRPNFKMDESRLNEWDFVFNEFTGHKPEVWLILTMLTW